MSKCVYQAARECGLKTVGQFHGYTFWIVGGSFSHPVMGHCYHVRQHGNKEFRGIMPYSWNGRINQTIFEETTT